MFQYLLCICVNHRVFLFQIQVYYKNFIKLNPKVTTVEKKCNVGSEGIEHTITSRALNPLIRWHFSDLRHAHKIAVLVRIATEIKSVVVFITLSRVV